jgi:hypothetical protein
MARLAVRRTAKGKAAWLMGLNGHRRPGEPDTQTSGADITGLQNQKITEDHRWLAHP